MAVVVIKPFWLIPFWVVGEFTTLFGAYSSGDWDVHWGYEILTHGHIAVVFAFRTGNKGSASTFGLPLLGQPTKKEG